MDEGDRRTWVVERMTTYFGDSNLNGRFGTEDLVHAFLRGKYNVHDALDISWEDGDWNGDGIFDSSDLVTAFQDGGYELGPRPIIVVVPEASSMILSAIGLLSILMLFRRRLAGQW